MKIIDFHTHVFPDNIAVMVMDKLKESSGLTPISSGTLSDLQKSMQQNGISMSVIAHIATTGRQTQKINDNAIAQLSVSGIIPFGSVHPDCTEWRSELYRIREAGIKGIKLHPDFQDYYFDSPWVIECLSLARELDLCVLVHGGRDASFPDDHHCTPKMVCKALDKVSGVKLVVAHLGGLHYLDDVERLLMGRGDLYIDASIVEIYPSHVDSQILRIINGFPAEKILFATDSPWDDQGRVINYYQSLGIESERLDMLFHKNAERLLGVKV